MIYDGVINKPPLNEETLAHYGVLGMKWGVRKNPEKAYSKATKELAKRKKKVVKADKKYKRALNRPFGSLYRSTSQKLNKLNKKQNKLKKWEDAMEKYFKGTEFEIAKTKDQKISKAKKYHRYDMDFLEAIQNRDDVLNNNNKLLKEYSKYLDDPEKYWKKKK